jgi:hypothetical protein
VQLPLAAVSSREGNRLTKDSRGLYGQADSTLTHCFVVANGTSIFTRRTPLRQKFARDVLFFGGSRSYAVYSGPVKPIAPAPAPV